jgi:hypothetical protein
MCSQWKSVATRSAIALPPDCERGCTGAHAGVFGNADRAEWMLVKAGPGVLPEVRRALDSECAVVRGRAIRMVAWQGDTDSIDKLNTMRKTGGSEGRSCGMGSRENREPSSDAAAVIRILIKGFPGLPRNRIGFTSPFPSRRGRESGRRFRSPRCFDLRKARTDASSW